MSERPPFRPVAEHRRGHANRLEDRSLRSSLAWVVRAQENNRPHKRRGGRGYLGNLTRRLLHAACEVVRMASVSSASSEEFLGLRRELAPDSALQCLRQEALLPCLVNHVPDSRFRNPFLEGHFSPGAGATGRDRFRVALCYLGDCAFRAWFSASL